MRSETRANGSTIHTVAAEIDAVGRSTGARALAVVCDLRDAQACEASLIISQRPLTAPKVVVDALERHLGAGGA